MGARQRVIGFEAKTLLSIQRYHRQAGITDVHNTGGT